jgi:hypothetical protein
MTKPVMVLRNVKTTALTHSEHDQNFLNLRDATISLRGGTGGTVVASDLNGTITLVAGTNVSITGDNTAKTITINAANESQNIFQNIAVAGQSTIVADSTNDTLTLVAGSNVSITTDAATDTITINNTAPGGNAFGTIAIAGQDNVVADSSSDTVQFIGSWTDDGELGIRGIDIIPAASVDQIQFIVRNNTFVTAGTKSGNFTPDFNRATGGAAIQKISYGGPLNVRLPTGMIKGDTMRLYIINPTASVATVDLVGTGSKRYRVARNRGQRYFEEDDAFTYVYSLPANGGNMVMAIFYDGADYWTEINTDYEE